MAYLHHLDNLYKNQDILMFKECYALEKIHGCVKKGTKISLPNGEEVNIEDINVGDIVLTYNVIDKNFSHALVLNVLKKPVNNTLKWIKLTLENGRILQCTEDHPILTFNRGWVHAIDLEETDDIIDFSS
jgi:intein/homing endonuclease